MCMAYAACEAMACMFGAGHFAGLLVGAYLGWGLVPQRLPASPAASGGAQQRSSSNDGATEDEEDEKEGALDVMHVSHAKPLTR